MGEYHLIRPVGNANGVFMIIFKKINVITVDFLVFLVIAVSAIRQLFIAVASAGTKLILFLAS